MPLQVEHLVARPFFLLVLAWLLGSQASFAGTVEVIAIRHGESLNNILSQKKNPISFFVEMYRQSGARGATGTIIHNPVLSSEGREQAAALHDILFPQNKDKDKFLLGKNGKKAHFFVSPLNRTIQTALLVFKDQLAQAGIPMIPNPNITEHRKSVSEEGFEDSSRPLQLLDFEMQEFLPKETRSTGNPAEFEMKEIVGKEKKSSGKGKLETWKNKFKEEMAECCNKSWWPKESTESAESLNKRIIAFKDELKNLPDDSRVIIVSHGTFLRTLFFGISELGENNYHIRNLGMLTGTFDKKTGDWVKEQPLALCWDPKTHSAASKDSDSGNSCFDKVLAPDGVIVDKGPVYEITSPPSYFESWQNRRLRIINQDGIVGVTWSEKKHGGKLKGAALVLGEADACSFPPQYQNGRSTACLVIQRVNLDEMQNPVWSPVPSNPEEILQLSWPKVDEKTTKYVEESIPIKP